MSPPGEWMRKYAMVSPHFWLARSATGNALRQQGPHASYVALYLITSPHSNMLGLYDLPLETLSHDTALPLETAKEALAQVCTTGFAEYDEAEKTVWIPEMARFQVGPTLKPADSRRVRILRLLEDFQDSTFHAKFLERYAEAYGLERKPTHKREGGTVNRLKSAHALDRLLQEQQQNVS